MPPALGLVTGDGSMTGALLRVDATEGFRLAVSNEQRALSGCFAMELKSAKVAEAGSLGGGISSYLGGFSWVESDDGVAGTLDEVLRHPVFKLSFLRSELPDDGCSCPSLEEMVCTDAESLAMDLEAARVRGPMGFAAAGSAS